MVIIIFPTEWEGEILFLVQILSMASASALAWAFLYGQYFMNREVDFY